MTFTEEVTAQTAMFSPFAEAADETISAEGPALFATEASSPFMEAIAGEHEQDEYGQALAEAISELRDEAFDEAVAYLAQETEAAVAERFADETPGHPHERTSFAEAQLSAVRFEAERYLAALETNFQSMDVASLSEAEIDRQFEALAPQTGDLTPAGEEFIGGLVKKARKAVRFVANAAKNVGKVIGKVSGVVLGPVLGKLKALIRPLLKRVLALAIGRLPAPLQPAARTLAGKLGFEAEGSDESTFEEEAEGPMSPTNLTDLEDLTDGFDAALGEALVGGGAEFAPEGEYETSWEADEAPMGEQLEQLAEARGALIDTLAGSDEAQVGPAIEQFVPALLGALKLGVNLIGRPKVVRFLAGYISKLIGQWVGPQLAGPLSNAIVDTGLRLVSLEAEEEADGLAREAGPIALASVIEDSVRRLAEQEDYIFENEDLTQLAISEAFSRAAATHFPPRFVRPDLRQAPSLGGAFVRRRPRSVRSYNKYSRVPEIEITPQIADAIPTFGGATLGSSLRAAGVTFPFRARVHIYQAAPGTTVASIVRTDRTLGSATNTPFHPLTPAAAGVLLREPQMGVAVPPSFRRSARRLGVGQRIYALQPIGAASPAFGPGSAARKASGRIRPSRVRVAVDRAAAQVRIALYFSEARAQRMAQAIRTGRGHGALLQALTEAYRRADGSGTGVPLAREDFVETEDLVGGGRLGSAERRTLLRRLRAAVLPALAEWSRRDADAFARAAAHPAPGVTVRLLLRPVDGLRPSPLPSARGTARRDAATAPSVTISVVSGPHRP
jgi:hypothetical protein